MMLTGQVKWELWIIFVFNQMEVIGDLDKQVCSIWIFVAAFGV